MDLVSEHVVLSNSIISEIKLLSGIAKANGSLISIKDIATLTQLSLSEEQLEAVWSEIHDLVTLYELRNGLVLEREHGNVRNYWRILERETRNRDRAKNYANYARKFVSFCSGKETTLIAVSGSTSYQAVSETDDLDFF